MQSSDSLSIPNFLINPVDHNITEFLSTEKLTGEFWDIVKKTGVIYYNVGHALYFTVDGNTAHASENVIDNMRSVIDDEDMFIISTADHIEAPLRFGFSVIIYGLGDFFNYEEHYNKNYGQK